MIIATLKNGTKVKVNDAWNSQAYHCTVASVTALHGEPFLRYSHGGWMHSANNVVPAHFIAKAEIVNE